MKLTKSAKARLCVVAAAGLACGAYAQVSSALALKSLHEALKKTLPERNHSFIPANIRAIEAGAEQAGAALGQ